MDLVKKNDEANQAANRSSAIQLIELNIPVNKAVMTRSRDLLNMRFYVIYLHLHNLSGFYPIVT